MSLFYVFFLFPFQNDCCPVLVLSLLFLPCFNKHSPQATPPSDPINSWQKQTESR